MRKTSGNTKSSKRIKIIFFVMVFIVLGGYFGYKRIRVQNISYADQISELKVRDGKLIVEADLPFYRSLISYMMNPSFADSNVLEVSLAESIDWSFKNNKKMVIDFYDDNFPEIKQINVMNHDREILKSITVD